MVYSNLKAEIIRKKMTVLELAALMNLSKKALENKLNGLRDFTLEEIEFILKTFDDCSFEYLFQFSR